MNALNLDELVDLSRETRVPSVSIYLPTHRTGREMQQDPIRLRNALREAREQGAAAGMDAGAVDEALTPADALVEDGDFWQHQGDGLAMLLAPGVSHVLRLPRSFDDLVVVADRFQLRPLLPLDGDVDYLLLAMSQNTVRLFRGSRSGLRELPATELPDNLAEALWMDDPEESLQYHGYRAPGALRAMYHGQGVGKNDEDQKTDLMRYFRAVDEGLRKHSGDPPLPLVLACVDYYVPLFREASDHPGLIEQNVSGSPDAASEEDLHRAAWDIVRPRLEQERAEALARYGDFAAAGHATDDLDAVTLAAQSGRVENLFVKSGERRWGRPSPDGVVPPEVHGERRPGDVELLDHAAVMTLLHGGRVFPMGEADIDDGAGVAATLRF